MYERVQQHGRVSIRQHETVAVRPDGVFRVIAEKLLPQTVGDWSQSHRRSGMAGVCLLHRIHRKSANRVDTQLIELCTGGGDRLVTDGHQSLLAKRAAETALILKLDDIDARWIHLCQPLQVYI